MTPRIRLLLVITSILLVVLTILILVLTGPSARRPTSPFQPYPSRAPAVNIGDPATQERLVTIMKEQTPILTDDVEIVYSPLIKKYYIHKKTPAANAIVLDFFEKNEIVDLLYQPNMVIYVNENALYYMLEEERRLFPDHPDTQRLDI